MSLKKATVLIVLVLLVDQLSKIYIKTHFRLGEDVALLSWFKIYFIENDGMAWGTTFSDFLPFISDKAAKLGLTIFRIVAVLGIGYWLYSCIKQKLGTALTTAVSLIFAGAMGNIIDSVFYGVVFSESNGQTATLFPSGGGYAELFHGKVVDMLYLPIWKGYLPEWLPFIGGKYFTFFEPVFNVADVAISLGFLFLVLGNRKVFSNEKIQES